LSVVVLLTVVLSFIAACPLAATGISPSLICPAQFQSDIDITSFPSCSVEIRIDGGPYESTLVGTLEFGFGLWPDEPDFMGIAFREVSMEIQNVAMTVDAVGVGSDEMREYVFAYADWGMLFDCFKSHNPAAVSARNNWPWTPGSNIVLSITEELNETEAQHLLFAGQVIEYESLTIHYADGSRIVCGPKVLTVGANFTRSNGAWSVDYILQASDDEHATLQDGSVTIVVGAVPPLRPQYLAFLAGAPFVFVSAIVCFLRRRKHTTAIS